MKRDLEQTFPYVENDELKQAKSLTKTTKNNKQMNYSVHTINLGVLMK